MAVNVEHDDGVATVTIDRPDVKNALDHETMSELADELREVGESDARAVVLRGAGGTFCAGADVNDLANFGHISPPKIVEMIENDLHEIIRQLVRMRKPTVAKVQGHAVGAGCNLALACDLTVAKESATFAELFTQIGLSQDSGSSYLLPRLVGMKKAKELVFTGKEINGSDAEEMGLINHAYPDDDFDERADELVDELASGPTRAIGASKSLLHYGANNDLDATLEREAWVQSSVAKSDDVEEGVMAFIEGREPEFEGE
ncbi:MAG: enoyl-CoA hydratase [Halobacteria archaeon]|nr:enoyl-CoA hydratase [Halobacteria archaeon]